MTRFSGHKGILALWASVGALPTLEHCGRRGTEQLQVAPQRPAGDVEIVQPNHLLERDVAAAEHLPEAGHPRLEVEPAAAPGLDVLVLARDQRTRADEAHVAAQHVEE